MFHIRVFGTFASALTFTGAVCNLEGELPQTIGQFQGTFFSVHSNPLLSGEIPDSIGNMTNIVVIYIEHTNITGPVPAAIGEIQYNSIVQDLKTKSS